MMLAMVLPIVLFAQNNVSKQKLDRPVIENKPYKYEYVIIRGIIHQEMHTVTFDAGESVSYTHLRAHET